MLVLQPNYSKFMVEVFGQKELKKSIRSIKLEGGKKTNFSLRGSTTLCKPGHFQINLFSGVFHP